MKRRSGLATAASVGGGVVVGAGAVLAVQGLTSVDPRIASGIGTALGAGIAAVGAMAGSPTARDIGLGMAGSSGAIFANDLLFAKEETPEQPQLPGRQAAGDRQRTLEAIRQELANNNNDPLRAGR